MARCLAYLNVSAPHASSTHKGQKRAPDSLKQELTDGRKLPCECYELNLAPLEEQEVPLTTDPSLQPQLYAL